MSIVIICNVVVMVPEVNASARCLNNEDTRCESKSSRFTIINLCFSAVYAVDLIMKLAAFRSEFFVDRMNGIDLAVVIADCLSLLVEHAFSGSIPNLSMLKILRNLRLLRTSRLMTMFPELQILVRGFVSALLAMFWGMLLIMILIFVFSIISVQVIYPLSAELAKKSMFDDEWCEMAFSSVQHAFVFYLQTVVAGDSWGTCIRPIILEYGRTLIFFITIFACVQLGFANLILTVIVDKASAAREEDAAVRLGDMKQAEMAAVAKLESVFKACDFDGSGEVDLEELRKGISSVEEVHDLFKILDIDEEDLHQVFRLMDADQSGKLSYGEFVTGLKKAETQDNRIKLMLIQLQLAHLQSHLQSFVEKSEFANRPGSKAYDLEDQHAASEQDRFAKANIQRADHLTSSTTNGLSPTLPYPSISADIFKMSRDEALEKKIDELVFAMEKIVFKMSGIIIEETRLVTPRTAEVPRLIL